MDLTSIHPVLNDHPSPPTMSLVSIPHLLGESRAYSPDDEYLNLADLSLDDLDLSDVNLLDDEEGEWLRIAGLTLRQTTRMRCQCIRSRFDSYVKTAIVARSSSGARQTFKRLW